MLTYSQKHMLLYSLEAPRRGASNEYPHHVFMFKWRNKKNAFIRGTRFRRQVLFFITLPFMKKKKKKKKVLHVNVP